MSAVAVAPLPCGTARRQGQRRSTTGVQGSEPTVRPSAGPDNRPAGPRARRAALAVLLVVLAVPAATAPAAASPTPSPSGACRSFGRGGSPPGSGSFTPAPTPVPRRRHVPAGSGGRVYAENCSGCHGAQGEGLVGPPLAAAGFASLVGPMVTQGGISMPPFEGVLSDRRGRGRRFRRRGTRRSGGPHGRGRPAAATCTASIAPAATAPPAAAARSPRATTPPTSPSTLPPRRSRP